MNFQPWLFSTECTVDMVESANSDKHCRICMGSKRVIFTVRHPPSLNVAAATAPLLAILLMRNPETRSKTTALISSPLRHSMFSSFCLGWRLLTNNITSLNPFFDEKRNARRGGFWKSGEARRNNISQSSPPKRMMFYICGLLRLKVSNFSSVRVFSS